MTRYGYARVSSRGQAADGTSLDTQEATLREQGCTEVVREAFTGHSEHRPALDALMARLTSGDELVVTKMDRFARSLSDGLTLLDEMDGRGVRVTVLNVGTLAGDPASRLLRNVMLAVAEFERDMIAERTSEGKRRARERPGWREGRPRATSHGHPRAWHEDRIGRGEETVAQACADMGIGRSTWYRHKAVPAEAWGREVEPDRPASL